MSSLSTTAGPIETLTDEQRLAAGTRTTNIFIEAGPGTGKTTVSAQRFGMQRFAPENRHDPRAVIAVSFTRAATYVLRHRVQRLWGSDSLVWPHRIITLDTIMCDLLHDLLRVGLLVWPNQADLWPDGEIQLDVHDSWASFSGSTWNRTTYSLTVVDRQVRITPGFLRTGAPSVPATEVVPRLLQGICTHQDVRDLLTQALRDPISVEYIRNRLKATTRALVVDEVFDANDLDIAIIEAAINAGVAVTLVGDPWQALYVFRGARPQAIPELLQRTRVRTVPLTESFRWREESQRSLAVALREGRGVVLPITDPARSIEDLDVVLALRWKSLWELGAGVLPLAFHGFKGGYEEAAATLLLNHVTRSIFDLDATYLTDALTALAIQDRDVIRQLEPDLQRVTEVLGAGEKVAVNAAYDELVEVVKTLSPRLLRPAHHAHTGRLVEIQRRLAYPGRPVPGLTTHQAKGGEWAVVGVRLTDSERAALAAGLSVEEDTHRKLYVACTRAQIRTVEVPVAESAQSRATPARRSRSPRGRR